MILNVSLFNNNCTEIFTMVIEYIVKTNILKELSSAEIIYVSITCILKKRVQILKSLTHKIICVFWIIYFEWLQMGALVLAVTVISDVQASGSVMSNIKLKYSSC